MLGLAGVIASACGSGREPRAEGPADPAASPLRAAPPAAADGKPEALPPPAVTFVAPSPWKSKAEQPVTVDPPDLAQETWRVLVTQNRPLQVATPRWQSLPAAENVELAMQAGIRFRCMVTAAEVVPDANDFGTKLKGWVLTRYLRCSADGWHSWSEYPHRERILADGKRESLLVAEALLRESA